MAHGWKQAIFKAPLHFIASVPIAAASLIIPPAGTAYVKWRTQAEADDEATGRDTPEKAKIDLWSQTLLVKGALKIWKDDD